MKLDFTEALKAPFSQNNWISQCIVGGIILLIPIVNIFVTGFAVRYIKNISNRINQIPSITDNTFMLGIKFSFGSFLLNLPLLLINAFIAVTAINQATNGSSNTFILNGISTILSLAIAVLMPALAINFSNNENVTSMIDFNIALEIIKRDTSNYLIMLFYALLIIVIYGVIETICCITIIGIILLPFVIFLSTVSIANIVGQYFAILKTKK